MSNRQLTRILSMLAATILTASASYAQTSKVEVAKNLNYRQPSTPTVLDNYLFNTFNASGKKVYNLKGFEIAGTSKPVISLKMNPAGSSFAVLTSDGKKSTLAVYSNWKANEIIYRLPDYISPSSMTYSADSRSLYVSDATGLLSGYDTKNYQQIVSAPLGIPFSQMMASGNGYFIAGVNGSRIAVVNLGNNSIRTWLSAGAPVKDVAFSDDSSLLAVLDRDGNIDIYNTRDFNREYGQISRPGSSAVSIHPENKYIALARGTGIEVVNMTDQTDTALISEPTDNVSYVRFLKDGKDNIYLSYNAKDAVKYKLIKGLVPHYSQLLRDEVLARMEDWSRMRDDESEAEYQARMTEESRQSQVRLFEEEIATRMADDLVMHSELRLGAYNPKENTLSLEFDNMPAVYLSVPEKDMDDFMDVSNLEFRNTIYGITQNDKFELVYAEVYNKKNGKVYEFNNRDRRQLDFLYSSDDFVPIELVKQSGMEEVKLSDLRNSVVDKAKQDNLISDHTHIDVNTGVVTDFDAMGNKITNYKVNFKYTVDAEFSAREDFPAGKYDISTSNAAKSMLEIIRQAFVTDFAQYIHPGKKVVIRITGSADALPITGTIAYNGMYGEYVDEPYTLGNDLSSITVTRQSGIKKNEQLAFTRAAAVRDFIDRNLPELGVMNTDYNYVVEVSDKKGGEYRRINVEFLFVDAF